jgi:hexosaminidase
MYFMPQPKFIKEQDSQRNFNISNGYIATNAGDLLENELKRYGSSAACVEDCELYYAIISTDKKVVIPELPAELDDSAARKDGFYLNADENGLKIVSRHPRGVLYGWQLWNQFNQDEIIFAGTVIDYPDTEFRAFHMDMRYGFPKFERMLSIIDELSACRYNKFILEYENRFPYQKHSDITDKLHFAPEQIREIQDYAAQRFIEIIPLQQTIGHLEYVLKLPQYYHLREMRKFPETDKPYCFNSVGFKHYNDIDEICASNEEAYAVVESMLDEIISAHPDSRYVHLGCDEAWNLLSCERCIEKFGEDGANRLYAGHINRMAKKVLDAGKTPIIWDDMLRHFTDSELEQLDKRIVIMIWLYYESNYKLAKELTKRFCNAGFTVIGAAASKCGEGPEPQYLDMPWYELRMGNVNMWGRVCAEEGIDGFCMTVWSNYSGTIAPPHPFFDTIWYPVLFAAEKMWNLDAVSDGFDERFAMSFFGVDDAKLFHGSTAARFECIERVCRECKRHSYEAEVIRIMELTSIYRLKALAIGRELYKLNMDVTEAEKRIIKNRISEVSAMREELKPLVREIVAKYYSESDAEVFVRSRFDADEELIKRYLS